MQSKASRTVVMREMARMEIGTNINFVDGSYCVWFLQANNPYSYLRSLSMTVELDRSDPEDNASIFRMYKGNGLKNILSTTAADLPNVRTDLESGTFDLDESYDYLIVAVSKADADYLRISYKFEEPFYIWVSGLFILAGICGLITLIGMCVICIVECALEPLIRPMKATVMRNANDVLYRAKEADQLHV